MLCTQQYKQRALMAQKYNLAFNHLVLNSDVLPLRSICLRHLRGTVTLARYNISQYWQIVFSPSVTFHLQSSSLAKQTLQNSYRWSTLQSNQNTSQRLDIFEHLRYQRTPPLVLQTTSITECNNLSCAQVNSHHYKQELIQC